MDVRINKKLPEHRRRMRDRSLNKISRYKYWGMLAAVVAGALYGCAENRHAVIAVTGTNIGVEISENPVNQVPQAKLGYQRGEIAIVPTNRSGSKDPVKPNTMLTDNTGAKGVANVLMELKHSNIFSFGKGGIYQRLAVGKTAVSQPGAAFMFARNQEGKIGTETAKMIPKAFLGQ